MSVTGCRLAAGALGLAAWLGAVGCKRSEPAPAPRAGDAAVDAASSSGRALPAGGPATLATVPADDLPAASGAPLRVVFAERGTGVAYVARRSDGVHVVHAGRSGPRVNVVDQLVLSPDGARVAFGAEVDGTWRMLVDGELGVTSTSVGLPVFSPDGRHLAYEAKIGDGTRVVIDGVEGPPAAALHGAPVFGADSTRVAFVEAPARDRAGSLVIAGPAPAQRIVRCTGVHEFVTDEARTRIAAVVDEGEKRRVVTFAFAPDGPLERGPAWDAISKPVLGNGGSLAYLAERSGQRFIVLDSKHASLPNGASPSGAPVIRPGGGVGVLVTSSDGQAFLHEAFAGGEGPASSRHDEAADLAYGAGGATAYAARRGDAWFVVANGTEGPALDRVVSPAFSPDGKLLVYRARKDGKRFVVIADRKGETVRQLPPYEQVFPVRFDADGKSIAYGVKDGPRLLWLVEPLPSR